MANESPICSAFKWKPNWPSTKVSWARYKKSTRPGGPHPTGRLPGHERPENPAPSGKSDNGRGPGQQAGPVWSPNGNGAAQALPQWRERGDLTWKGENNEDGPIQETAWMKGPRVAKKHWAAGAPPAPDGSTALPAAATRVPSLLGCPRPHPGWGRGVKPRADVCR